MTGHYVGPVILAEEVEAKEKARNITIYKNEVFKDIDLITHKHVDAREDMGARSANAVSSDIAEGVDAAVIARYVDLRDAQLRVLMQGVLQDEYVEAADDRMTLDEGAYIYKLTMPEKWNDNTLRPLMKYMHRFLVWGALYDWYLQFGSQMAQSYGAQLNTIEENIQSIMQGPSIVKKPLQPFGPAKAF